MCHVSLSVYSTERSGPLGPLAFKGKVNREALLASSSREWQFIHSFNLNQSLNCFVFWKKLQSRHQQSLLSFAKSVTSI